MSSACDEQEDNDDSTHLNPVLFNEWIVTKSIEKAGEDSIETLPTGNDVLYPTTLKLNKDRTFSGKGECNSYSGSLKLNESNISLQTEIATDCGPSEWYWNFFNCLRILDQYDIEDSIMTLYNDSHQFKLELVR